MPPDIPQPVEEARAHPRRHLSRSKASGFPVDARRLVHLREDSPLPRRERLLAVAHRLAARHGRPAPVSLYPSLHVSDQCRGVGACAAFCPTGALSPYREGGWSGVEFDAAACVGCGLCLQACRENALSFVPRTGPAGEGWQRLTRFPVRACSACGKAFPALGEQSVCPGCRLARRTAMGGVPARQPTTGEYPAEGKGEA